MAIIDSVNNEDWAALVFETYPDEFVSEKEKQTDKYMKSRGDYFFNIAAAQYAENESIKRNYDLVKGKLHSRDFYDEPLVKSFVEEIQKQEDLPPDVKHYPILNPPINTLVGELSNRPDIAKIKAMDADSQSEELKAKTDIVVQLIIQEAKGAILAKHAQEGGEPLTDEEAQQLTMNEVQDLLDNYTSIAEKWANRVLTACKIEFNMKEISEDCFRDLIICSKQYYHVYEDNSKTGFGVENVNPRNAWAIKLANKKYTSDVSGTGKGTPAAGILSVMELSEIIEKLNLTKEEIDHLRKIGNTPNHLLVPSSFSTNAVGINTVRYPQASRLLEQERLILEAQLSDGNEDDITSALGLSTSVGSFGNKFVVLQAYYLSKKKIGNVTFLDEKGDVQTMMVDESYKKIPNEISVEWGYINQWMKLLKVGPHVYKVEPFKLFDYCPIIGVVHEGKNTKAKSLVDLMKPLQTIYNVAMNQLFRILEKEYGVMVDYPLRKIVVPKDGDGQDATEIFEAEARAKGITYSDDSVENARAQVGNTSQIKVIDASRTNEIKSRWEVAQMVKNECWELVGITRQRLGGTSGATETATATQAGLSQSYTQTEPIFTQHQYVLNQVYQAIVDAAQYVTINKPTSTISYLANDGDKAFLQVNGSDLSMRDLKVFITSSTQDMKIFQKMQDLGQAVLQNDGDLYEVSLLYSTNSFRQMQGIMKKLKDQKDKFKQQEQQTQQDQLKQQQDQFQAQMQYQAEHDRITMENENNENRLQRINDIDKAIINSFSKQDDNTKDANGDGTPDVYEISRLNNDIASVQNEHQRSLLELQQKNQIEANKLSAKREELQNDRENMANDLKIAKIQAANKPKPAPKKKKK